MLKNAAKRFFVVARSSLWDCQEFCLFKYVNPNSGSCNTSHLWRNKRYQPTATVESVCLSLFLLSVFHLQYWTKRKTVKLLVSCYRDLHYAESLLDYARSTFRSWTAAATSLHKLDSQRVRCRSGFWQPHRERCWSSNTNWSESSQKRYIHHNFIIITELVFLFREFGYMKKEGTG